MEGCCQAEVQVVFPEGSCLIVLLGSGNMGLILVAVGGTFGGLYLFYQGFRMLRFKRMILGTPLSRIHSASIGLVEVTGTPMGPYVLTAPVTGDPCYYYRVQAWQWVEPDNKHAWKAVLDESMFVPFFLEDSTGRVLVNPQGAQMDIHRSFSDEIGAVIFSTPGLCPPHVRDFLAMRGLIPAEKIKVEERVISPGSRCSFLALWEKIPSGIPGLLSRTCIPLHRRCLVSLAVR
jgi:hypothetical protein